MTETGHAENDVIDVLERWEQFGGTWQVLNRVGARVTISLRRCDGGEEQQRLTCVDPAVLAWLDGRTDSASP
ncbi:MAG: hypothetical protein M3Y06_10085 [Actinomycetota bacterium]|nr:hypothetical protein [Actinomycetota bacterium]